MTLERRLRLVRIGVVYFALASFAVVGVRLNVVPANPPVAAGEVEASPRPAAAANPSAAPAVTPSSDARAVAAEAVPVGSQATAAPVGAVAPAAVDPAETKPADDETGNADYGTSLLDESYSATANLTAEIVQPAGDYAANPSAAIVVSTVEGAGVELTVDEQVISHRNLGKRIVDHKHHITTYEYYGLRLRAGENTLSVTALGKDGIRGEAATRTVFVGGAAVRLHGTLPQGTKLHADGRTAVPYTVTGTDQWAHPAGDGNLIRLTILSGDASFQNVAAPKTAAGKALQPVPGATPTPSANARQVTVEFKDGKATAMLVPGLVAGDIVVQAKSAAATDEETYFVAPFLRKAFVTGILQAGIGAVPGGTDGDGQLDNGGSRRARAAFYATGKVANETVATVAYETQNRLAPSSQYGPFVDNPNERPYQSYGDTSSRRDDAISQDRLYGRVERGRDALTYGRLTVNTGAPDVADGFQQQVNGLRLDAVSADGRSRLTAFESRNDLAFAREIFSATGLATIGQVAHGNIVIGSDSVVLVAFDRRSGAIVTQTALTPNVDYTLNSSNGQLHFITVPTPFDQNLNPQVVLVTYQYYGTTRDAKTVGGRGELGLGRGGALKLGLGYVNDSSGVGNFGLLNADFTGKLPGGGFAFGFTQSNGVSPANTVVGLTQTGAGGTSGLALGGTSGRAFQARLKTRELGTDLDLNYQSSSIGFQNPFGGFTSPGFTNLVGSVRRQLGQGADIALAFNAQRNSGYGTTSTQDEIGIVARKAFGKTFSLHGGIDIHQSGGSLQPIPLATTAAAAAASGAPVATAAPVAAAASSLSNVGSVTQLNVGAAWNPRPGLQLSLDRTADIGGTPSLTSPSLTTAGLTADLTKTIKGYVRESWSSAPYVSFANATSAYTIPVSGTRSTALGLSEALGTRLSADQELSLNDTANGKDVLVTQGVREHLALLKNISGDLSFQTSRGTQSTLTTSAAAGGLPTLGVVGSSNGFNAYGINLGYANENNFRFAGGYQFRTGDGGGGSTLTLGAGGPVGTDLGFLGSVQQAHGPGITTNDSKIGLSYRPANDDRGASLLEYEIHDGVTYGSTKANVLSFEQVYRPTQRLELSARAAYKLDGNSDYAARTTLLDLRGTQRFGSIFDLGSEVKFLNVPGISGAKQTAFAVEGGVRVLDKVRLAVGYNFEGAADPSLVAAPTRRGFYATVTSVIDHVFGWGSSRH